MIPHRRARSIAGLAMSVAMIVDYFSHPIFGLTRTHALDWLESGIACTLT